MEKNKQVLEFGDIIQEVNPFVSYETLRSMYIDYVEWLGIPWQKYVNMKTKEIIEEFKHFSLYYYLPF